MKIKYSNKFFIYTRNLNKYLKDNNFSFEVFGSENGQHIPSVAYVERWSFHFYPYIFGEIGICFINENKRIYTASINMETGEILDKSKYLPKFIKTFLFEIRNLGFSNAERFILGI